MIRLPALRSTRLSLTVGRSNRERGQVLVLFVLALVALLLMSALLFDAAQSLVLRRRLQGAADAAAIAAASTFGASSVGACASSGSAPKDAVRAAAVGAVDSNTTGLTLDSVVVTCTTLAGAPAVRVSLSTTTPAYFIGLLQPDGMRVSASGTAVNGQVSVNKFSILTLNPHTTGWSRNNGCPSVLFSGGPTIVMDGSLQVNSSCAAGLGGAMGTNGNATTLTLNYGADVRLTGGFVQGPLQVNPPPLTGQPAVPDPLKALPDLLATASLTTRATSRTVINNQNRVLDPGIYVGGIQLRNRSQAYLRPGIYVLNGGGLDLGAQSSLFSIDASQSSTTAPTWRSDCRLTCGVLIYNMGSATTFGPITVGAGATLMLLPYQPGIAAFGNLLLWQAATPATSDTYTQPPIALNGGGTVDITGTVYAPQAQMFLTGGSGGSGGSTVDLTVQFITYDLQIQGNSSFHFRYRSDAFARPFDYGLVE